MNEHNQSPSLLPGQVLRDFGKSSAQFAHAIRPAVTSDFAPFEKEEVEQSIPVRFEKIVRKYPDHLAVKSETQAISYAALNKAANRMARVIVAKCGEDATPIALLLENDVPMIVGITAAFKTPKICVPLDPAYHGARASYVLENSRAKAIVTNNRNLSLAHELARSTCQVINIDDLDESVASENLSHSMFPGDPAYVLYTSGSTGQSRGVLYDHRYVLHQMKRYTNSLRICASDRLTLFISCSGGHGISTALSALLNGAGLCMQSPKERGLDDLASWLIKEEITVFISTPTLFRNFARALNATPLFPRLRLIKLGSEPVAKADVGLYKQLFSSECVLVNWISTTETGNFAHYFIDHRTEIGGETVPIGFPPEDVEIFLLDDTGQEVERGKVGEIAVKSRYFPPGYWRAADLTAAKFLLDPDAGDKRIYLTGDLGRMNSDGCLEHLGRKDDQVKIRGYRIEVAEIESALMNLESIEEAAVVARNDHGEEKHLVAYILPRFRNSPPSVTLIRRALRERLPDYMVPSAFVFMETMPRTNTGKVDRRALPEPKNLRPEIDDPFAPPTTPVEERLAKIWARVLGVNRVGIHDDFFELGGHSLSGIRLITAIQREFQLNLPLRRFFESSTVAGLAACIEAERTSGAFANQKQTKRCSYLFELKPGNNRKPVFFLPGGVGGDYEFLVYARLAHYVGPDYPFYGLRARSADGTKQAHASVKEMAADYIQEIRSFQSEGPYFLVGNCIGGVVAYEIARQLKAQGQKIACLAMMDTHRPSISIDLRYRARRGIDCLRSIIAGSLGNYRAVRIAFHWKQIREQSWKDKLSYLYGKTDSILIGIRQILFSSTASSGPGNAAAMRRMESIQRGYGRTLYRYRPRPYEGRVSLVVNEEAYRNDPTLGWADLVLGGIEVPSPRRS